MKTAAEYSRAWRKNSPDKARSNEQRYRARHPGRREEAHARHRKTPKWKRNSAYIGRKFKYGIEPREWDRMIIESCGRCAICDVITEPSGMRGLVLDHDHDTGAIRGLICLACNQVLGFIEAHNLDTEWMLRARNYLGRPF